MEAIRAATLLPATFLGVADELGSIEEGKIADLLLDADPLESISHTRKIRTVVLGGIPLVVNVLLGSALLGQSHTAYGRMGLARKPCQLRRVRADSGGSERDRTLLQLDVLRRHCEHAVGVAVVRRTR
jgi:hypothetical protein